MPLCHSCAGGHFPCNHGVAGKLLVARSLAVLGTVHSKLPPWLKSSKSTVTTGPGFCVCIGSVRSHSRRLRDLDKICRWLARWPKELVESGYARSVDHMQPAKLAEKTHSSENACTVHRHTRSRHFDMDTNSAVGAELNGARAPSMPDIQAIVAANGHCYSVSWHIVRLRTLRLHVNSSGLATRQFV